MLKQTKHLFGYLFVMHCSRTRCRVRDASSAACAGSMHEPEQKLRQQWREPQVFCHPSTHRSVASYNIFTGFTPKGRVLWDSHLPIYCSYPVILIIIIIIMVVNILRSSTLILLEVVRSLVLVACLVFTLLLLLVVVVVVVLSCRMLRVSLSQNSSKSDSIPDQETKHYNQTYILIQ